MPESTIQTERGQGFDVFISYARDDYFHDGTIIDNNVVMQLTKTLDENKISYWLDLKKVAHGDDWATIIVTNIKKASLFLLILTDNANKSVNVPKEIKIAVDHGIKIIPVIVDETKAQGAIEYHITNLDYFKCRFSKHCDFSTLMETVRQELQRKEYNENIRIQIHDVENEIHDVEASISSINNEIRARESEIEQFSEALRSEGKKLEQLKSQLASLKSDGPSVPVPPVSKSGNNLKDLLSAIKKNKWFLVIPAIALAAVIYLFFTLVKTKTPDEYLTDIIEDYSPEITSLKPLYADYKKGDSKATMLLGAAILDSINGTKAKKTGRWLVQKAANDNMAEAQNLIGTFFYRGTNGFQLDYDSASYWFSKGIENNSLDALRNLGEAYADGKYKGKEETAPRQSEAITILRQASRRGDSKSMVRLGRLYYNTLDSIKSYPQKAKKMDEENDSSRYWMERALEDPSLQPALRSVAQYFIGMYYYRKYVVNKDDSSCGKMAMKWFEEASKNEEAHPYSYYYLGKLYEYLEDNKDRAISYYKIAAHYEVKEAIRRLKDLGQQ